MVTHVTTALSAKGCIAETCRTIIYSMGFDEEIGGPRGAAHLAKVLTDRYGSDGVSFIFDEGFTGVDLDHGTQFARLGLAEKGCLTLKMHVHTPGGHSSNPPPHTGVGIMSEIIVAMENNPSDLKLREGNPLLGYLECLAEYGQVEAGFKRDVRDPRRWSALVKRLEKQKAMKPFLGTTQVGTLVECCTDCRQWTSSMEGPSSMLFPR